MIKLELDEIRDHFSNEELKQIMNTIYNENEEAITALNEDSELKCENLFNKKNTRTIENGFSIKTVIQKKKQEEVAIYLEEVNLCENEDEWFEIYKRLKL